MRRLVTGIEPKVEFIYVDAPQLASGGYGWWNAKAIEGTEPSKKIYEGWRETRAWAVSYFAHQQPLDGVFGFSQGAALAALLVGLRTPNGVTSGEQPLRFDFALLVSGFISGDPAHAALYDARESFRMPSLHMVGRADTVVPPGASHALAARFPRPLVVEHDAGHVIASSAKIRGVVAAFLAERHAQVRQS